MEKPVRASIPDAAPREEDPAGSEAGDSERPSYGSEGETGEKHEERRGSCGVPPAEPGARWESLKETGRTGQEAS